MVCVVGPGGIVVGRGWTGGFLDLRAGREKRVNVALLQEV